MKIQSLVTAAAFVALSATNVDAATFTIGNVDYDLTTITGSFNDNADLLMSQAWWGDANLASSLISLSRETLAGLPNSDPILGSNIRGPFFATTENTINCLTCVNTTSVSFNGQINGFLLPRDQEVTFAIETSTAVSAVPLPAGGLLLLSGLLGFAGFKRRKA